MSKQKIANSMSKFSLFCNFDKGILSVLHFFKIIIKNLLGRLP